MTAKIGVLIACLAVFLLIACEKGDDKGKSQPAAKDASSGRQDVAKTQSEIGKEIMLGDGVVARVDRVRTWESYEDDVPPVNPYQHYSGQGSKNGGFTLSVEPFAGERRVKPVGRFWELLLWMENKGNKDAGVLLFGKNEEGLDVRLILDDDRELLMRGYRVPGFSIADVSLVIASQGRLKTDLKPGEKTWLLVVFDVPKEYASARFQIKDALPVTILLPK